VLTACNAMDASDHAPYAPDLVLLTHHARKSGYELCREWKNSPETRPDSGSHDHRLSDLEDKIRASKPSRLPE